MSHLQFEEWLVSEDELLPEERKALKSHLSTCQSCTQLATAWSDVSLTLHKPKFVSPQPGFVHRWEQHLDTDEDRRKSWRGWLIVILGVILAAGIILTPVVSSLPLPSDLLTQILDSLTSALAFSQAISSLFESLGRMLPELTLPIIWAIVNLSTLSMIVVWVFTYKKITLTQGVYK